MPIWIMATKVSELTVAHWYLLIFTPISINRLLDHLEQKKYMQSNFFMVT